MADRPWIASQSDRALLQELLDEARRRRANVPSRPPTDDSRSTGEYHQAPEIYVAKPQTTEGIPRLLRADLGTTGTGTATGTNESGSEFDEPGRAECDVYQIVQNGVTGDAELHLVGIGIFVHNVTTSALAQDWIPVARTKFGKWVAMSSGGGGAPLIRFSVASAGPFLEDTSVECHTVTGVILDITCGSAGLTAGDEVTIWDPSGCWFNIPIENLENAHGTAVHMSRGDTFAISECSEDDPTETCFWMVINLCCLEEVAGTSS